jgi:hypothetical protein
MSDKREDIFNVHSDIRYDIVGDGESVLLKEDAFKAMDEYANGWEDKYKEANQFICDIGKLAGLDGLGYDDMKASIEDFRDAIDEKKKGMCLEFLFFYTK